MEKLKSLPFMGLFFIYVVYLGTQLYGFYYAPDGPVETHKMQISGVQGELDGLKKKLAEGKKFLKTIDAKKEEIEVLGKRLSDYQGTLSEGLDVPSMMKLLLTEAKIMNIKVDRLEPTHRTQKDYYTEQEFKLAVRGTFQQVAIFNQRVSQMQRILRIDQYSIKPTDIASNILNATLFVRAYQYVEGRANGAGGKR